MLLSMSSNRLIAMDKVTSIHREIDRYIIVCVAVRLKQNNNKLSSYRNQNEKLRLLTPSQNYEPVGD